MEDRSMRIKLQKIKLMKMWEMLNRKIDKEYHMTTIQLVADLGIEAE